MEDVKTALGAGNLQEVERLLNVAREKFPTDAPVLKFQEEIGVTIRQRQAAELTEVLKDAQTAVSREQYAYAAERLKTVPWATSGVSGAAGVWPGSKEVVELSK